MSQIEIIQIPLLADNYAYLLKDKATDKTAVVDPSAAPPILKLLEEKKWQLDYVLNTHHHWDHTDGNLHLKEVTGCEVVGSKIDEHRIPGITIALGDGDSWQLGEAEAHILLTPGHTLGAICYWFEESHAVFTGDTLFTLGCGRTFEGTAEQMWTSLQRLGKLPDETKIYCGHEYTVNNARFALSIDPDNKSLRERLAKAQDLRKKGLSTVPAKMGLENQANPFLRAKDHHVFASLRSLKDSF
jgi:hydroxyacylglutathione hydrolase